MRTVTLALVMVCLWVLLWGSASVANITTGILVALAIIIFIPGVRQPGKARGQGPPFGRPLAVIRLVGYMLVHAVESNIVLTREVLARRSKVRTGVIGVELPGCSDETVTLINNLVALVPGTMPLDLTMDPTVLYVHVLHLHDVDDAKREIMRLTELCVRAFGSDEAIAALAGREVKP